MSLTAWKKEYWKIMSLTAWIMNIINFFYALGDMILIIPFFTLLVT